MTEFAEIMMIVRLNWPFFVAIGLMIGLAILVWPGVIESEADYMKRILEEIPDMDDHTSANIEHMLANAKAKSDKKYGENE